MARKKAKTRFIPEYGYDWEDMFYIEDLNNGTYSYRKEDPNPWYNLRIRPNAINNDCRHETLACGSNLDRILNTVSLYVSMFNTPEEMFEHETTHTQHGFKVGKRMLEIYDEHWEEVGDDTVISDFYPDIYEAIKRGKKTRIISGPNVKIRMCEDEDSFFVEGRWAEWFEEFIDCCMSFEGYTKAEFMEHIVEYIGGEDIEVMNDVFAGLKSIGCKGIKSMKKLNMYQWTEALAPMVNTWVDSDSSSYYGISDEEDEDE